MIWWTGLAPWEFEFPSPGSLTSNFPSLLVQKETVRPSALARAPTCTTPTTLNTHTHTHTHPQHSTHTHTHTHTLTNNTHPVNRCRANMVHIRQSRPESKQNGSQKRASLFHYPHQRWRPFAERDRETIQGYLTHMTTPTPLGP